MNLQKAPAVLLDWFRLKTQGQNPTQFGDAVLPVVDVGSLYGAEMQAIGGSNSAAGAFPRLLTAVIGTASRYLGVAGSVTMGAAAGTQVRISVGVRIPRNAALFPLFDTYVAVPQAGRVYYAGGQLPYPIILPAQSQVEVLVDGDAGGADHVSGLLLYLEDPLRG